MTREEAEQAMLNKYKVLEEKTSTLYNDAFHKHRPAKKDDGPVQVSDTPAQKPKTGNVVMEALDNPEKKVVRRFINQFKGEFVMDYKQIRQCLQEGMTMHCPLWECMVKFYYEEEPVVDMPAEETI